MNVTFYICNSPLGRLMLTADAQQLCGLYLESQEKFKKLFTQKYAKPVSLTSQERCSITQADSTQHLEIFKATEQWLNSYFKGQRPKMDIPLQLEGSEFQKQVWGLLMDIPYGSTTTYGALAKHFAQKYGREHMSAQAIGGAVGRNPISIIVPCHRVLGSDGSLTGYAGGIDKKRQLLQIEGVKLNFK